MMPTLSRACGHPGCPRTAERRSTRCTQHQVEKDHKWEDRRRGTASERGYTSRWRRIRRIYLKNNPSCVSCNRPAEEVDHILPLRRGGTHRFDNLQSLCKSCHSRKTMEENRGVGGRIEAR